MVFYQIVPDRFGLIFLDTQAVLRDLWPPTLLDMILSVPVQPVHRRIAVPGA